MTAIIVFSRRGVHLAPKDGRDYNALFVPADDDLVVLRDLSISTDEIAQRVRAGGRIPLWREKRGQILVYGYLPPQLKDLRQALRVWLAEDYAPQGCSAFFFVLGNWVVHGVKEVDDERRDTWRSAVLSYPANALADGVAGAAADLLLRFPAKEICVAVDGPLERQEQFKAALQSIDVACLPFAALRPPATVASLYRHRDYGVPMVLSMGLLALVFMAMLVHLVLGYIESARLQGKVSDIRQQIQGIQINKSIGYIHQPQPILAEMHKAFQQQPSAILDAAGRFGHALGELNAVEFEVGPTVNLDDGLMPVTIKFNKVFDKLLVNQESTTRQLLAQVPWVRQASGIPEGNGLKLLLSLQIGSPKNGPAVPSATSVFQPLLPAPEEAAPASSPAPAANTAAVAPPSAMPGMVISGTPVLTPPTLAPEPQSVPSLPGTGGQP